LVVVGLGISGYAFAQVATGQLSACVSKDGETKFIVTGFTKKQTCGKNDRLVTWNSTTQSNKQFRVKDSVGTDFGELISYDAEPQAKTTTYYEPEDIFLGIYQSSEPSSAFITLTSLDVAYFSAPGCSGNMYLSSDTYQGVRLQSAMILGSDYSKTYTASINSLSNYNVQSSKAASGDCTDSAPTILKSYSLREISLPALVGPIYYVKD
jgi:hypothetical protein